MSFEEKSAAATLVVMLVVFGGYFLNVWRMLAAGPVLIAKAWPMIGGMTVVLVVMLIVAHIAIAAFSREHGSDERDRMIDLRAERNGGFVLGAGVFAAMGLTMTAQPLFVIANALLAALVASEIASLVSKLVYYRRSI